MKYNGQIYLNYLISGYCFRMFKLDVVRKKLTKRAIFVAQKPCIKVAKI